MTRILVCGASRHGATLDIIDALARGLAARELEVVDKTIGEVGGLEGFDAVVIGSAVYVGRWLPEAAAFTRQHAQQLANLDVWLFSSGPLGDPPFPTTDPLDVAELMALIGARDHRVFAGRLDSDNLGLGEKLIVKAVRAPRGDYRDFSAVKAWANEIADALALAADEVSTPTPRYTREALRIAAQH